MRAMAPFRILLCASLVTLGTACNDDTQSNPVPHDAATDAPAQVDSGSDAGLGADAASDAPADAISDAPADASGGG